MNSVQKSSKIRNFCTEFLYFAYFTKIEPFYIVKFHIFVFFLQKLTFLMQTELPERQKALMQVSVGEC